MAKDKKEDNLKKEDKALVKQGKNKSKKGKTVHKAVKITFLMLLLFLIIGAGSVAAMFMVFYGDELLLSEEELTISSSNSYVYNKDGVETATLNDGNSRMLVSYSELPEMLPKAYIAIEDERFESHNGVDIKRTLGAVGTFILNGGKSDFGGSTITQQLVKNLTKEDAASGIAGVTRKVKEMVRAMQIENMLSKNQIMELYLNILFLGENVSGVQTAANYYFNKDVKDLNLTECAFIAGITHSPNYYNPYKATDEVKAETKERVEVVLAQMKKVGFIDEAQQEEAKNTELVFENGQKSVIQSYYVEAALSQVTKDFIELKGGDISEDAARLMLMRGGYKIYTAEDSKVQDEMEKVFEDTSLYMYTSAGGQTSQGAMVVIDHTNGHVVGVVGGRGEKTAQFTLNIATQSKLQTGSSIKPLAVYAPGLEYGVITAGSTVYDEPLTLAGTALKNFSPTDFRGYMTARTALTVSQNIPAIKIVLKIGLDKSADFLEKLGITSLVAADRLAAPALALGGQTNGISPLEMAGAYATLANDGKYIEPTFYTRVVDSTGKTILEAKQETRQVMSAENAYIIQDMCKGPVTGAGGTASYLALSGIDSAAKTGTTNDDMDRWMCGFTPYYATATWVGFGAVRERVPARNVNPAGKLMEKVWDAIHADLPDKRFDRPEGIVTATACLDSGMKPTELCSADPRGARTRSEIYASSNVPSEPCNIHVRMNVCTTTGLLAGTYCPTESRVCLTRPEEGGNAWKRAADAKYMAPEEYCTVHTSAPVVTPPPVTQPEPETDPDPLPTNNVTEETPPPANELEETPNENNVNAT